MRGKIVNLCIGLMNLLLGILVLLYTTYIPQDITLITVQEGYVINYLKIGLYIVCITTIVIDIIQSYNLKSDTTFNTAYILGCCVISFIFIKQPIISVFSILSGLIVLFKSFRENLVELNSITAISVSLVVIASILILGLIVYNYKNLGQYIRNKENENQLEYVDNYFKYVTELEEKYSQPYINVCKEGKFGYLTPDGNMPIGFIYDYASPFIRIKAFNKTFYVALVCSGTQSKIILKNQREVMTYQSESAVQNYGAKLQELKDIYKNVLKQPGKMEYEISSENEVNSAKAYLETSDEYSFRYDYNYEYDVVVIQSNMGLGDKYELVKKEDKNYRISLETTYLDYDSTNLYLFSNGLIPCYDLSKKTQGYFTSYGKKETMTGNAQILDFFGDRILLKNFNNDTIYFIDSNYEKISEEYKKIYICNDDKYVVQGEDTYFKVVDDNFEKIFEKEYAVINPRLVEHNLYVALDSTENIKFNDYGYPIMSWKILNGQGELIGDDVQYIYDLVYQKPDNKGILEDNYLEFVENLKNIKYNFVGDKFYLNY